MQELLDPEERGCLPQAGWLVLASGLLSTLTLVLHVVEALPGDPAWAVLLALASLAGMVTGAVMVSARAGMRVEPATEHLVRWRRAGPWSREDRVDLGSVEAVNIRREKIRDAGSVRLYVHHVEVLTPLGPWQARAFREYEHARDFALQLSDALGKPVVNRGE